MKKLTTICPALALLASLALLGATLGCQHIGQQQPAGAKTTTYYCPMHPEVVQNSPGKCPKCGMDLTEKN